MIRGKGPSILDISWDYFEKFTLRQLCHVGNGSWYIHVIGGRISSRSD